MAEEGLREMNTELSKRAISEMIGTFALVFIGTGAIVVNDMTGGSISHLGISLAFGLTVMTMIYAVGDVSGPISIRRSQWHSGRHDVCPVGNS